MTSGVLAANGIYNLDNPKFLSFMKAKKEKEQQEAIEKARKARSELLERIDGIKTIREKRGRGEDNFFKNWTGPEMKNYLQYKKHPKDAAMPSKVALIKARILSIIHRPSPTCSPHSSDNETDINPTVNQGTTAITAAAATNTTSQNLNPLLFLASMAPVPEDNHCWVATNDDDQVGRI